MMPVSKLKVLGIDFINAKNCHDFFDELAEKGGLMTVPSGPGLASIPEAPVYYNSLLKSDYVLTDSGYMVMIWNLISKNKITRISGLEYIDHFLEHADKNSRLLLINPRKEEADDNVKLLEEHSFKKENIYSYEAPFYGKNQAIDDPELLASINAFKPNFILINLGGNTQEILGLYIKENISFSPLIICTGAAIAFKTGHQVGIPMWADRFFLGWLFRCISKPSVYIPRYLASFKLIFLVLKYRQQAVPSTVNQ